MAKLTVEKIECEICGAYDEGLVIRKFLRKSAICEKCLSKVFKQFRKDK